ncbi:hypothetical protein LUU34_00007800 [Aix galericulata]|nr:hypothetical protein LUU34_00007800 [Aix galericulata]
MLALIQPQQTSNFADCLSSCRRRGAEEKVSLPEVCGGGGGVGEERSFLTASLPHGGDRAARTVTRPRRGDMATLWDRASPCLGRPQ